MAQTETKKELIDKYEWLIYNQEIDLTNWECDFLDNVGNELDAEDGFLTDLQIEHLERVYEKYNK